MRIFTILLLFFGFNQLIYSQDQKSNISLNYSNTSRIDVLKKIEASTGYRFYFQEDWFDKNVLISGDYSNKSIQDILNKVFEDTDLNFFIDKNKIILTKNSIINDKFQNDKSKNSNVPIFFQQYDSIKKNKGEEETAPIALIGKETIGSEVDLYTLSGHITDLKDEKHLSGITVKVKNTAITTTTNSEGFYSLKLPEGLATIEIESILYNNTSRKIMIYSNGTLDFSIIEKINQLKEVVVKGKNSQNIRTAITGVTTIEAEGVKTVPLVLGERDVLKIALTIPGIKTAGEGSSGFNVRGGKEDQNLMLLDNGTIYNPAHLFGFFSSLNPYTINKVDIYKGGIPSEFGGRLSSVFDITSKNGNTEKFSGEGGIGPVTSNLTASIPVVKGKASLLVGGRATYSDWILKSLDDENLKNSQASFYDLFAKYTHKINKNNAVEGTGYYSKDKYSITPDSLYQYSNRLISLKWKHSFNEKNTSELNVSNSEYKFSINYESANPESFIFKYKIDETQASLKFNSELNSKHKFTYGIASKLYKVNPGEINPQGASTVTPIKIDSEKGLESAVFFSDKFKITEKLLLDIGARYSYYAALGESTQKVYQDGVPKTPSTVVEEKKYGNNEVINSNGGFEPRVALRYIFDESLFVKAGFDKNYQYIHLLTNNTTQSPTDTWKLSDLNVKPESGLQYSLGIFKKLDYQDIELSVEGYYKTSKNILDYKVGANLLLNKDLETELLQGDGKAYGVEFLLKKSVGRLNGWIGYTYSRTFIKLDSQFNDEKVNNGAYFPTNFDKPHDVSVVMNYKITHRYSFSSNFVYQTGRPITYPIGKYEYNGASYTLYSDRNKYRIPDYYRLDIGINIEGNHKIKKLAHSFWNISVYNVLGRNNPYSIFFVTKEGQVKAYQTSIFSVPIPTITYNFKF